MNEPTYRLRSALPRCCMTCAYLGADKPICLLEWTQSFDEATAFVQPRGLCDFWSPGAYANALGQGGDAHAD